MGMLNAAGRNVLFMDADGATPLTEIPRLITRLQIGADVVIGSRVAQQPGEIQVITSLRRRLIGRIFSGFVNIVAMPGFADTQCGFKLFRGEVVRNIFSRQRLNDFAFDVEILFIATRLGYTVEEVPINWVNQAGSKVNLVTDSLKMLIDVLRIKWIHRFEQWETSPMANDARLPRNRHPDIGDHRSGSSAIRLSPPRIRACGFPALGSSRRLPNAGQGNLARVSDAGRRQWEAFQQRVELLPGQSALTPPA